MAQNKKYDHINFKPPTLVALQAKRGLVLRAKFGHGGTSVGIARARDLKNRRVLSPRTITRMYSYFSRHFVDKQGKNFFNKEKPSKGYIAWQLWGGDAGAAWCHKIYFNFMISLR